MKQKNMILVAVAVGCGLVAAFLTSRMSASPQEQEMVEIPVAAIDLPVGTMLKKETMAQQVTFKKFSRDSLPPEFTGNPDELSEKRLVRTIRAGEAFNPKDLTTTMAISPPPGKSLYAIPADPISAAGGFALPGSHVDILASITLRNQGNRNTTRVIPLLTDMLVIAVDTRTDNAEGADTGAPTLSRVTLAADAKEMILLQKAMTRNAIMKLSLRGETEAVVWPEIAYEEKLAMLDDQPGISETNVGSEDENNPTDDSLDNGPKVEMVLLPVPIEDLPSGTEITRDLIEKKFKEAEFTKAPGNSVADMNEYLGKHLTSKLAADQFVPKSFLGEKPTPKVAQADDSITPKAIPKMPEVNPDIKPKNKPVFLTKRIQNGSKTFEYKWQLLPDGEYHYLGKNLLTSDSRNNTLPTDPEDDKTSPEDEEKNEDAENPFRIAA